MRLALSLLALLLACSEEKTGDTAPGDGGTEDSGWDGGGGDGGDAPVDADGDGVPVDDDCDDSNAGIFPGADERCDGVDEDCDGLIDEDAIDATTGWQDADADGYGDAAAPLADCDPDGIVANDLDCDDSDDAVHPDAIEVCDAADVDQDCNGLADDDDSGVDPATMATWYVDGDGDGYGDSDLPLSACDQPAGAADIGEDCDDNDAAHNPEAPCDDLWPGDYSGDLSLEVTVREFGISDTCTGTIDVSFDSAGVATGAGECTFAGLLLPYGEVELTVTGALDATAAMASGTMSGTVAGVTATPDWTAVVGSAAGVRDGTFSGSETSGGYTLSYGGGFTLEK